MKKETDPLVKLAALELNIDSNSNTNCNALCEKVYEYAGQDGYKIMNETSECICTVQEAPLTQK